jgi:hypothetical protein
MLTTHAVLYKSRRYKEAVIEIMNGIVGKIGYFNDVAITRIQPSYRVYGYYHPFFYQSSKFGNVASVQPATQFTFPM